MRFVCQICFSHAKKSKNGKQWDPKTLTQPMHEIGMSEAYNFLHPSLDGPKKLEKRHVHLH